MVVAGHGSADGTAAGEDLILRRFTADGAPDPSFGNNGAGLVALPLVAGGPDRATDLLRSPDGGLLVAGSAFDLGGHGGGVLLRLRADGTPDPRWPTPGTRPGDPAAHRYWGVAAAPDGRLVVAGPSGAGPDGTDAALRRFFDDVPTATLTAPDPAAAETGPDAGSFRVALDRPAPFDVRVAYAVGGSAAPPGAAGADYAGVGTTADARVVLIPAGQTGATLTITPVDDAAPEPAETVRLTLLPGPAYALTAGAAEATVTIADNDAPASATVVGRHVFYNSSKFDGNNPAANPADDAAVAPDKSALLPGQLATFANLTSYTKGINGVMIDVAGLPAGAGPLADDFTFRTGSSPDAAAWQFGPSPVSVAVRRGAGAGGSDRVTLTWPDGAIRDAWLQVTVKANAATGLAAPDVFYFGNLVGEVGDPLSPGRVTAYDFARARMEMPAPAPLNSRTDFDRDGRVTALDLLTVRTHLFASVPLLAAPAAPASPFSASPTVLRALLARHMTSLSGQGLAAAVVG